MNTTLLSSRGLLARAVPVAIIVFACGLAATQFQQRKLETTCNESIEATRFYDLTTKISQMTIQLGRVESIILLNKTPLNFIRERQEIEKSIDSMSRDLETVRISMNGIEISRERVVISCDDVARLVDLLAFMNILVGTFIAFGLHAGFLARQAETEHP
jgi:hypothetical protein